jgi:hypothetical protein
MNVIILSHKRSLNKSEGLITANLNNHITLICDVVPNKSGDRYKPFIKHIDNLVVSKKFDIIEITQKVLSCDKIYCVSENLFPIQAQLESYYGINNMSAFAAEIFSNKQKMDDFCRSVGLGHNVPKSITPTFHSQLDIFDGDEFFTKPDIGTGSNSFYPKSEQNLPTIEYRRWNNKHHFLDHLTKLEHNNKFFEINKKGIQNERFNNIPCKMMAQKYYWSEQPSTAPIGYVKDGKVEILTILKMAKVKYGDILDFNKSPIEQHSISKKSDIAKDMACWSVPISEIDKEQYGIMYNFIQTIVDKLKVKDIHFAGPDFHISDNKLIAIDFNTRMGQFINILDKLPGNNIFNNIGNDKEPEITTHLLWGCTQLKPGIIKDIKNIEVVEKYLNYLNDKIKVGMKIPEFQNLQNKKFSMNLNITGRDQQELFDNYKDANQLLHNCITY